MKYEMIFGDDDFSGQSNELAEVKLWNDLLGPNFVSMEELHCMSAGGLIPRGSVILAMRRIIAEPKRWTLEDKKAGQLPDVGAKVDGGKVVFVNGFNVVTELKSGAVIVSSPKTFLNIFKPIETQEERAKREEDEFVSLVEFEYNKMPNEISFRAGIRAAYRKLKGGE